MKSAQDKAKGVTPFTTRVLQRFAEEMDHMDLADFANAERGLIAPLPENGLIRDETGILLNGPAYGFLDEVGDGNGHWSTLNPSLQRQGRLMRRHGLFQVCEGIYQVRGIGSSITFIEGRSGVIVVDSGMSLAIAASARKLYETHRPGREVKAMIISHPHGDHVGGMAALVDPEAVRSGAVKIYAPEGFLEELYSENLFAGRVMRRRAGWMFGMQLEPGPRGHAGIGIGLVNAKGRRAALVPTDYIRATGQVLTLDGLDFQFQLARDAEAPTELHWFLPQLGALTLSENCEQTLHNTYTPRGAKTRNPLVWSKIIQEALDMWGDKAQVLYSCHSWPVWGNEQVRRHLGLARDAYRFINDQTLYYASRGMTPDEIAEAIRFPDALRRHWGTREHYGTLRHNARGTYTYYMGWFDGNPARLNPLPRVEAARRYVECMGGAESVLDKGRRAFDQGEYRWAAELLDHVVTAEPGHAEARRLLADAYEQMGYQAEAGPWRNIYLTGAMELRDGIRRGPVPPEGSEDGLTVGMLCDYLSIQIDGLAAAELAFACNITLLGDDGSEQRSVMYVSNGVISHSDGRHVADAEVSVSTPMRPFNRLFFGAIGLREAREQGMDVRGKADLLERLLSHRGDFDPWFPIVTRG